MFGPWITVAMLALESSEVIGLRVAKLAQGGSDAQNEAHLLVNEKIVAVFDAGKDEQKSSDLVAFLNQFDVDGKKK